MKSNVTLKEVRNEFAEVKGSMFFCIKAIYAAFTDADGKCKLPTNLAKIMPTKKQAQAEAQSILDWGKVGQQREIKRKNTVIYSTIKASSDMVLRYYVAKYNGKIAK
jgi:hypothetical protein